MAGRTVRLFAGLTLAAVVCLLNIGEVAGDCTFAVDQVGSAGCVNYDLSALANPKGFNISDEVTPRTSYLINVCGNIDPSVLPSVCQLNPPAPAYQVYEGIRCPYLGLLDSKKTYPVNADNSSAGVRVVYFNGDNSTGDDELHSLLDYGTAAIGDPEQNKPPKRVLRSDASDPFPHRAVIIDLFCDPSAGVGQPEEAFEWPMAVYRIKWRSAHACPASTSTTACPAAAFEATWASLAFRPRPQWFDDVKFGIFIHWGLFSVPSYRSEWYWRMLRTGNADVVNFHNRVYGCSGVQPEKYPCTGEKFTYAEFPSLFHAELFNPDEWATLFKNSGAKYVVLTSKHHEGWCNFPSEQHWNWNSMDVGPNRDLVGELSDSVRAAGLHMGLYHSLREWYNPIFLQDNANNCTDAKFVDEILIPTLKDMTLRYKPEVIWADGASGDNPCSSDSVSYWKAPQFLSWLYNESPVKTTVVTNTRWGSGSGGDYASGPDRWTPGKKVPEKWESCFTIQRGSWGFDRTEGIDQFYNTTALLYQLVSTVSCNGNLLLNIGPTADGRIVPAFQERLLQMGAWLQVNGEAIYGTKPWQFQNDTEAGRIWYTQSKKTGAVYATSFDWPSPVDNKPGEIVLTQMKSSPSSVAVSLLGWGGGALTSHPAADGLHITAPDAAVTELPSPYAWVLKITGL